MDDSSMPARSRVALGVLLVALVSAETASALDADGARSEVRETLASVRADMAALRSKLDAKPRVSHPPEQLIAVGELSLRTKDYDQAIDTFNQVVELYRQGKAGQNAHADGLYLLGDSYFEAGQLLSARRQYSELLDLANQPPYDSYAGRSLARLVDVALHTGRLESLDTLRQQAARVSANDPSGSLDYARGKLEFARGNFAEARSVLGGVAPASSYYHQAQYVLGAMLAKQASAEAGAGLTAEARARLVVPANGERFAAAVTQFKKVTELRADTAAHRNVIDLAWLAIGRLHYESDAYLDAAEAYIKVDRESAVYYEMLYELAWVYIRVGDYQRAERALELLAVAAPDTLDVADSALLRADLMLRSGRYERALDAYAEVRDRFDPIRERVDEFLTTTQDPAIYYDRLVEEGMAIGGANLPDLVLDWVRNEARGERVFAVIDDVTEAREVLRRSHRLASKLNAVLSSPSRARAFPDLKAGLEKALGLINQIAQSRRMLALGLDDVDDAKFSGELGDVRAERRSLMARLDLVPISSTDFSRREEQGNRNWNKASQALQRVTLEADNLQAVINGLKQVLADPDQHGVTRDPASRMRFQAEIEANQQDLAVYRARIEAYREDVETGRVQVGFGDRRFVEDERVRERFRELFERELALIIERNPRDTTADYARSLIPILAEARSLEERLQETEAALESQVAEGAERLRQLVAEESERLEGFTQRLDALDQHARLLVGEVAMKNFSNVRDRLKGIVLRADVGIVQQAWELREEQQVRLRDLQRQRAIEEQTLDDELREVIDDAGEGQ
jgi:tetratricopeptide (TPR) repeat protein